MTGSDHSIPGPLALLGGEGLRPESAPLWRYLVPADGGSIVLVPTALAARKAGTAEYHIRLVKETLSTFGLEMQVVKILTAEQANDPELLKPLQRAGHIYLPGGEAHALCTTIRGSMTWKMIHTRHREGASLIAAGGAAVAFGEQAFIPLKPYPPDLDELVFELLEGLNLLPGTVILPYFNWLQAPVIDKITNLSPPHTTLIGIDDQAALIAREGRWSVEGLGSVTIMRHNEARQVINAGTSVPADVLSPIDTR